jgi:hypothetical protein
VRVKRPLKNGRFHRFSSLNVLYTIRSFEREAHPPSDGRRGRTNWRRRAFCISSKIRAALSSSPTFASVQPNSRWPSTPSADQSIVGRKKVNIECPNAQVYSDCASESGLRHSVMVTDWTTYLVGPDRKIKTILRKVKPADHQ